MIRVHGRAPRASGRACEGPAQLAEAPGGKTTATGGDAAALLDGAEIVDRVVPDLVLRGMLEAVQQAEAAEEE